VEAQPALQGQASQARGRVGRGHSHTSLTVTAHTSYGTESWGAFITRTQQQTCCCLPTECAGLSKIPYDFGKATTNSPLPHRVTYTSAYSWHRCRLAQVHVFPTDVLVVSGSLSSAKLSSKILRCSSVLLKSAGSGFSTLSDFGPGRIRGEEEFIGLLTVLHKMVS
jgi:hypothetical protein